MKSARRGRPPSFDRAEALSQAMLLFWRHGYEATSLQALTNAMAITPPSLYAAFGDKRRLFLEAVSLYAGSPPTALALVAEAATAREAAWAMLQGSAIRFTGTGTPPGCLLSSAAISCSAEAADVQAALSAIRQQIAAYLAAKIAADIAANALPPATNAPALAAHTMAVIQGMSTLARDGATRAALLEVAAIAMRAWPGGASPAG